MNSYINDTHFPFDMWNYFDSFGQRPHMTNYLEGYHRQLNACDERIQIFKRRLMKYILRKSVMCRVAQEQTQKCATRSKETRYARDDEKLKVAKAKYMQYMGFDTCQKVLHALFHRYINVIEDARDNSDEDFSLTA